jgi:hypothetical protein
MNIRKLQKPASVMNKIQTTKTKHQRSFKHQAPNYSWCLNFDLVLGAWCFSGAWCLELGAFSAA